MAPRWTLLLITSCAVFLDAGHKAKAHSREHGYGDIFIDKFTESCGEFVAEDVSCEQLGWPTSKRQYNIIDGIAYNGEADILEARLRELEPVVNYTAILTTELNFHGRRHNVRVPANRDKVKHMTLPSSAFTECWTSANKFDRLCAMAVAKNSIASVVDGLNVDDDDWVIFSDPDEIPNREVIRLLRECVVPIKKGQQHPNHLRLWSRAHYMYSTRCQVQQSLWTGPLSGELAQGPVAMKIGTMRTVGLMGVRKDDASWCRAKGPYASCGKAPPGSQLDVPCSAWHLSSFGGLDLLLHKMNDNADMWKQLEPREVVRMVEQCKEKDTNRTILNSKLLEHPARDYPHVPHSVADDGNRFAAFFDFNSAHNSPNQTSISTRRRRRRRTLQ